MEGDRLRNGFYRPPAGGKEVIFGVQLSLSEGGITRLFTESKDPGKK
ncbi:MAG: hypothetical protein K6U04_12015 [Armatimonadetes bacterium]|nr:hypothetical protein [Armatimonadota bacterium]